MSYRDTRRPLVRALPALTAVAVALLLLFLLQTGLVTASEDDITPLQSSYADMVVDFGDGHGLRQRIVFTETQISGLEALNRTGWSLEVADFEYGAAICAIEGVGCPATDCFCGNNKFWGYHYWEGGEWSSHSTGPSGSSITNGAVEGWAWGSVGSTPPELTQELLAAEAALQWLRPRQQEDGGYGNPGATVDVLLAVAATGARVDQWRSGSGYSMVDFLAANALPFAGTSAASAGKLATAVAAADLDPTDFAGLNLVDIINLTYDSATGAFGSSNSDQAWAMLGLRAAGAEAPGDAVDRLAGQVNANGGWGWAPGIVSDVDSTALALQALTAGGRPYTSPVVVNALAYLRSVQQTNGDGGFAHSPELSWALQSNTNSTAFAVQGLLATAQDPLAGNWRIASTSPISFLLNQQLPEGAFVYVDPPADVFATQQVVPALAGQSLPMPSRAVAARQALSWMAGQQRGDGSFGGFNPGATADAVLAIAAAGADPISFVSGAGNTPLDYLATQASSYSAQGASQAGKLVTAVSAGGSDPRDFGGIDLVARLQDYLDEATGTFGTGSTWEQAWGIIGLAASDLDVPDAALQTMRDIRVDGGGWGFQANASVADVDSTGLALQALRAGRVSRDDQAVEQALVFLRSVQNADGGFPGYSGATDAVSTGLAIQGLVAFGENPKSIYWTTHASDGSVSPLISQAPMKALLSLQSSEGGFAGYSGPNDPTATYQGLSGVMGRPWPLSEPRRMFLPLAVQAG